MPYKDPAQRLEYQREYSRRPHVLAKKRERYLDWKSSSGYRRQVAAKSRRAQLSRYGLSEQQYEKLLRLQNEVCAICRKSCSSDRRLAIDHCHKTGRVRGLLCMKCNAAVGRFEDDAEVLRRAIEYLESAFEGDE